MHTQKYWFTCLIIALIAFYSSSLAQNQSSDTTSLKKGVWALQFGISANFTLTSFQGKTLSAAYYLSDRNAVRGGVSISGNSNEGTASTTVIENDTSNGIVPGTNSTNSQSISFILQYIRYVNQSRPIHFYVGLGPSVSYSYSKSSADNSSQYTQRTWVRLTNSSSSTQWSIGAIGSVGIEWFPSPWFSLRAEYGENIQYQWLRTVSAREYTSNDTSYIPSRTDNSGTTKGWSFGSSSINFGLSVYW